MKPTWLSLLLLSVFVLVCAAAPACVASKAAPAALFPPLTLAWPAVHEDFTRGINDAANDSEIMAEEHSVLAAKAEALGSALSLRDLPALRKVQWASSMEKWAKRGIEDKLADGEIGPGVAKSLLEQLLNFTTDIQQLQSTY